MNYELCIVVCQLLSYYPYFSDSHHPKSDMIAAFSLNLHRNPKKRLLGVSFCYPFPVYNSRSPLIRGELKPRIHI